MLCLPSSHFSRDTTNFIGESDGTRYRNTTWNSQHATVRERRSNSEKIAKNCHNCKPSMDWNFLLCFLQYSSFSCLCHPSPSSFYVYSLHYFPFLELVSNKQLPTRATSQAVWGIFLRNSASFGTRRKRQVEVVPEATLQEMGEEKKKRRRGEREYRRDRKGGRRERVRVVSCFYLLISLFFLWLLHTAVQNAVIDTPQKFEEKQELIQLMKDVLALTSSQQQQHQYQQVSNNNKNKNNSNNNSIQHNSDDSTSLELGLKYKVLNCDIDLVPQDSPEFHRISELVLTDSATNSTHAHIHIENVFRVRRKGEWEKFTDTVFNTKLLFHGSKIGRHFCDNVWQCAFSVSVIERRARRKEEERGAGICLFLCYACRPSFLPLLFFVKQRIGWDLCHVACCCLFGLSIWACNGPMLVSSDAEFTLRQIPQLPWNTQRQVHNKDKIKKTVCFLCSTSRCEVSFLSNLPNTFVFNFFFHSFSHFLMTTTQVARVLGWCACVRWLWEMWKTTLLTCPTCYNLLSTITGKKKFTTCHCTAQLQLPFTRGNTKKNLVTPLNLRFFSLFFFSVCTIVFFSLFLFFLQLSRHTIKWHSQIGLRGWGVRDLQRGSTTHAICCGIFGEISRGPETATTSREERSETEAESNEQRTPTEGKHQPNL